MPKDQMPIQEHFIEYQSKAHGHTLLLYSPDVCYIILAMLTKFVSVLLFIQVFLRSKLEHIILTMGAVLSCMKT